MFFSINFVFLRLSKITFLHLNKMYYRGYYGPPPPVVVAPPRYGYGYGYGYYPPPPPPPRYGGHRYVYRRGCNVF